MESQQNKGPNKSGHKQAKRSHNHNTDKTMQTLTPIFAAGDLALMIPIIAVIMSLAIPIVAIITDFAKRRKVYELHHKERLAAIEKGVELPPLPVELIGAAPRGRPRYLLRGLVWLFTGLGILIALAGITRTEAEKVWMLGFIPTGVGLAYLIYYFVEGKRVQADEETAEAAAANRAR
jgi:hypothetical protein